VHSAIPAATAAAGTEIPCDCQPYSGAPPKWVADLISRYSDPLGSHIFKAKILRRKQPCQIGLRQ
jgi:hypothetical protein